LDGFRYELSFSDRWREVSYKWSNDPPDEWRRLSEAMHETIQLFEQLIQNGDTQ
jgi:hypothetical protein